MRLAWGLLLAMAQARAAEVTLELRSEALVRGPILMLSALANIEGQAASLDVRLGNAPLPGRVELRSRRDVADMLARQPQWRGHTVVWRGAQNVRIRSEAETMAGERVLAEAVQQLHAAFGERYVKLELSAAAPVADIPVAAGASRLQVRPLTVKWLPSRVAVWVDVLAGGVVQRSVVVPLQVAAWREILVARRAMGVGSRVAPADFEVSVQRVEAMVDEPATPDAMQRGGRLRRTLDSGEVMRRQDLAPPGAVLRGEKVRLLAGTDGLAIEVNAVAETDGLEGQAIAVRPAHGGGTVMARVTGPGEVRMDER